MSESREIATVVQPASAPVGSANPDWCGAIPQTAWGYGHAVQSLPPTPPGKPAPMLGAKAVGGAMALGVVAALASYQTARVYFPAHEADRAVISTAAKRPVRVIEMTGHVERQAAGMPDAPLRPMPPQPYPAAPVRTEPTPQPVVPSPLPLPAQQRALADPGDLSLAVMPSRAQYDGPSFERGAELCARFQMHRVDYLRHGRPAWRCSRE